MMRLLAMLLRAVRRNSEDGKDQRERAEHEGLDHADKQLQAVEEEQNRRRDFPDVVQAGVPVQTQP